MTKRLKNGVTLIEVLITIGIISTLTVVMVTVINPAESGRKSRDAKRMSDLGTIKRAIDLALADKQDLLSSPPIEITSTNFAGLDISKYIPAIPRDPAHGSSGSNQVVSIVSGNCVKSTADKSTMIYEFVSDEDNYTIRARLESINSCDSLSSDGFSSNYYEMGTKLNLFTP